MNEVTDSPVKTSVVTDSEAELIAAELPAQAFPSPEPPPPMLSPPVIARSTVQHPMRLSRSELAQRVRTLPTTIARAAWHAHYELSRLGAAGQAGLLSLVAAVVIAVSVLLPAQRSLQQLSSELLRTQSSGRGAPSGPAGVEHFLASLPTRGQIPAVLGTILQQAKEAGVSLDSGRYAFTSAKSGSIARYDLQFPVKASYPSVRTFINRTLAAVPAAGLDRLHVERKAVGDSVVSADVRFVVFVRTE